MYGPRIEGRGRLRWDKRREFAVRPRALGELGGGAGGADGLECESAVSLCGLLQSQGRGEGVRERRTGAPQPEPREAPRKQTAASMTARSRPHLSQSQSLSG